MPDRTFRFPHSTVVLTRHGATTSLHDGGTIIPATPEDTAEYRARAARLGYVDDTLAMCQEHELLHAIYGEIVCGGVSPVMFSLAHPDHPKVQPRQVLGAEEGWVLKLAEWINRYPRGRGF